MVLDERLKTALIILTSIALALGVLATVVVFYPSASYQPVVEQGNGVSFGAIPTSTPTSTLSSTIGLLPPTTPALTSSSIFQSDYTAPYPVVWNEGNEAFSITGASFNENQFSLTIAIQMGASADCVASNIRLVADESGTLQAPDSPSGASFIFPDTQTCQGTPGATYSEPVTFTVEPTTASPFLLTTGGNSNIFFEAATTTTGGVNIILPGDSG